MNSENEKALLRQRDVSVASSMAGRAVSMMDLTIGGAPASVVGGVGKRGRWRIAGY